MPVCNFFLRGQCKFGDQCRNDHPGTAQQRQTGFGNQAWAASSNAAEPSQQKILMFTAETITRDFSPNFDKPTWPLSSYGPAKYEPNLLSNLDVSPEELRVQAVTNLKMGGPDSYVESETAQINNAENAYTNLRANITQAYNQAVKQSQPTDTGITPTATSFSGSAFGSTAGTSSPYGAGNSAFGKPSAFGALGSTAAPSAFGGGDKGSAFGTSKSSTSVFGQSAFGQPAFGQSGFGQSTSASAFGQPPQPPSAFGQASQSASAFGQQPQSTSTFGQASQSQSFIKPATTGAFAAFAGANATPFGSGTASMTQSSSTPAMSNFGGTGSSAGGFSSFAGQQPSAFGLGASSSTDQASGGDSVFGQSSAFGQGPNNNTTTAAPSAFGGPAQQGGSVFGIPSTFGATQQPPAAQSAFGSGASMSVFTPASTSGGSVFGAGGSAFTGSQPSQSASGAPQGQSVFGASTFGSTSFSASQPKAPPPGPPDFAAAMAKSTYKPGLDKYDSLLPPNYLELLPKAARAAFEGNKFEWGAVPEWVPPVELR